MARYDEALPLAQQGTERFPSMPVMWFDLAALHRLRGDPDAEARTLEKAAELDVAGGEPLIRLAADRERSRQPDLAKSLFEQAIVKTPRDPGAHGQFAAFLWRQGEKAAALERIKEALRLDGGYAWGWGLLYDWSAATSQSKLPIEFARELTRQHPGETHAWLRLARLLSVPEERSERFATIDRAIALHPRCVEAHDLRAELLADEHHFTEARAACQSEVWGGQPPPELRARAAAITRLEGKLDQAIDEFKAVLAGHPALNWAWQELASCYWQKREAEAAFATASEWARVAPDDSTPLLFLARLKEQSGDGASAGDYYERAVALDSGNSEAASCLLRWQLTSRQLNAACETIRLLDWQGENDWMLAGKVCVATQQSDAQTCLRNLRELCLLPRAKPEALNLAWHGINGVGWHDAAERTLRPLVETTATNLQISELWLHFCTDCGRWPSLKLLDRLVQKGELGRQAVLQYLTLYGAKEYRAWSQANLFRRLVRRKRIRRLVRTHHDWLQKAAAGRQAVASAFVANRDYSRVIAWVTPWRDHPETSATLLGDLAIALRSRRRFAEATEVCRRAFALPPDHNRPCAVAWLAWDEALRGHALESANVLAHLRMDDLSPAWRELVGIIRSLNQIQNFGGKERASLARQTAADIQALFPGRSLSRTDPAIRVAIVQSIGRITRHGAGTLAHFWAIRQTKLPF